MKLQLHSDLHLEFYPDGGKELLAKLQPEADVLVLAGDITSLKRGPMYLAEAFANVARRWKHVVYVPGNHEFYGTSIEEGWQSIYAAVGSWTNVHVLRAGRTTIDGVRIRGGTGWFPELHAHPLAPPGAEGMGLRRFMTDFRVIREFEPAVYLEWKMLADQLAQTQGGPDKAEVIVTHHLPTEECVSPRFRGNALNAFFVSAFDVEAVGAKLWLHGHTHDRVDVTVGGTRIVANPHGYPREFYPDRQLRSVVLEVLPESPHAG